MKFTTAVFFSGNVRNITPGYGGAMKTPKMETFMGMLRSRLNKMTLLLLTGSLVLLLNFGAFFVQAEDRAKVAIDNLQHVRKLAEQGDPQAQEKLAGRYLIGNGVEKDFKEAALWYRKAADQGQENAQCSLGAMYAVGLGVAKDSKEAILLVFMALKHAFVYTNLVYACACIRMKVSAVHFLGEDFSWFETNLHAKVFYLRLELSFLHWLF